MSNEKEVKVLEVRTVGMCKDRIHMRMELPHYPSQEQIDGIEFAAKHIIGGRLVVLSGGSIKINGNFTISSHSNVNRHEGVGELNMQHLIAQSSEDHLNALHIAKLESEIKELKETIDSHVATNSSLVEEKTRLQNILDALDGVFQSVHVNSTRSKECRAKRHALNTFTRR